MKLTSIPNPIDVPLGLNSRGEPVTRAVTFSEFMADWILPHIGKGAKDVLRNARLYEAAKLADDTRTLEIADGLVAEIREALGKVQLNQALAFRLAPFFALIVGDE